MENNLDQNTNENRILEWVNGNTLGVDIVKKKYLQNGETFNEWIDRVSSGNNDLKRLILEKKFLPGGRILANRGINKTGAKGSLSNCYVLDTGDSIEEIYETCAQMARTYSYGGGVGIDISKLRPRGAFVNNTAKETTGAVSFMRTFDVVTGTIGQSGRRGALMISISSNHPDLPEFIGIKANTDLITNANISIRVNDKFMKAVEEDKDYLLHWPCDMDINENEIENIEEYDKLVKIETMCGNVYVKKVKARDLFVKIAANNWDYGEPGVLFWDRIENWHLMSNNKDFEYAGVNPCVSGDTLILTDEGYQRIDSLVGKPVNVWNGYEWSNVEPRITGHNQEMLKITFSNGCELTCTKYHKFVLNNNDRVEARNLKIGDKLIKYSFPVIKSEGMNFEDEKIPYSQGFFSGDGYMKRDEEPIIYLYGKKKELLPYITEGVVRNDVNENRIAVSIGKSSQHFNDKKYCPYLEYNVKERLEWLAGLIDSDGTRYSANGGVSITSIDFNFLKKVHKLLQSLGVDAVITDNRKEGKRLMPTHNHDNEYEEYSCKKTYRILISPTNTELLTKIGLVCHRVNISSKTNRNASRFITIKNIEESSVCDTVYCFNEPKNHSGIFNGVMTAQCAEEPLPKGGACLLGSMNISAYITDDKTFDYESFNNDVKIATVALNEIQVEGTTLHPLDVQKEAARKFRQIGLGLFDLAGALIKMGIRYGSKDAQDFADKVTHSMLISAFEKSCDLNDESGIHAVYDNMFDSEFYKNRIEPFISEKYKGKYPLNSQILTIAPTGTISTMINASSGGGEPIFALSYSRTTKSLHGKDEMYKVYPQVVLDYFGKNEISDEEFASLPDYYVSSSDIPWKERVEMQAAMQKNIDASISSTVNLPEKTTVEDVFGIYMYAWKCGLKGITIFRENCKRIAILSTSPKQEAKPDFPVTFAPKRPKSLDADFYQISANGHKFHIFVGIYAGRPYEFFAMPCGDDTEKIPNHKGKITKVKKRVYRFDSDLIHIDNIAVSEVETHDILGEINKISSIVNEGNRLTKEDVAKIKDMVYNIKSWSENNDREYRNVSLHVSGALRHGMPIKSVISLECKCNDVIVSFNSAVSRILSKYIPKEVTGEVCPDCGAAVVREGGCVHCSDPACGWSRCE